MGATEYRLYTFNPSIGIVQAVRLCAAQYSQRYGQAPNLAHCHPEISQPVIIDGIKVEPATGLLKFDLWLTHVDPELQLQLF